MDHLSQIIESNRLDPEFVKWMMETVPIDISENRSVTLYHVYQNHPWLSPHPEDSIEARWGLKKCEMIHAEIRAANDSITFIDRAYRKKNPKYADYSIRQQQHLLAKLTGEWTRSECREASLTPEKRTWLTAHRVDSARARRGSRKCETIDAEIRATHDSIAFIEKTYRKKDPHYADYSVRQQQHLLGQLAGELAVSGCREAPPTGEKKTAKQKSK